MALQCALPLASGAPAVSRHEATSLPSAASQQCGHCSSRRHRRLHITGAAAGQGSSGSSSFSSSAGRAGSAAFGAEGTASTPKEQAAAAPSGISAATPVTSPAAAEAQGGNSGSSSPWSLQRLQQQIRSLGLAGVTAYGLFNTLYYTCTFLFFWTCVAKVPSGQGVAATAKAFAGVMAMVWAGSQVTKAPRAAAALMLAPLVDRGMGWLQQALGLKTRRAVFLVFVGACLSLAAVLFTGVVLAWS